MKKFKMLRKFFKINHYFEKFKENVLKEVQVM
jgi:hypothetical protein